MTQQANCNSETVRRKGHGASTAHQRMRDAVANDVARQQRKRRKIEATFKTSDALVAHFRRTYNRTNDDPFPENISMKRFACLPKFDLLRSKDDGLLGYPALALYPVLCVRADYEDEDKWLQLSRENMGQLAGLSTHTVNKGLNELAHATMPVAPGATQRRPLLEYEMVQREQRRFYLYRPSFIRPKIEGDDWRGYLIHFHGEVVDSGTWARLSGRAKALYMIARSAAYFHRELYQLLEGVDLDDAEVRGQFFGEDYRDHKWDVVDVPLARLCAMAGMNAPDAVRVRAELNAAGLVEIIRLNDRVHVLKVYRRSCDRDDDANHRRLLRLERLEEAVL